MGEMSEAPVGVVQTDVRRPIDSVSFFVHFVSPEGIHAHRAATDTMPIAAYVAAARKPGHGKTFPPKPHPVAEPAPT